jgi:haloalkane dehalogenase
VFQHGQPASPCVWRNVMPHLEGRCRLIACDLIGMGRSEKLSPSGPDRYRYSEHRDYLFALWDALDLGDRVLLVLDDWGAVLGFDWPDRIVIASKVSFIWKPLRPLWIGRISPKRPAPCSERSDRSPDPRSGGQCEEARTAVRLRSPNG